jgi:hypothetical protein
MAEFLARLVRVLNPVTQSSVSPHTSLPQAFGGLESPFQTLESSVAGLSEKLDELSSLPTGWDGGTAKAIDNKALACCRAVINWFMRSTPGFETPDLIPTFNGFAQLEWHSDERSLELEYTPTGWSILGVILSRGSKPTYYTGEVSLDDPSALKPYYRWFIERELIWPFR